MYSSSNESSSNVHPDSMLINQCVTTSHSTPSPLSHTHRYRVRCTWYTPVTLGSRKSMALSTLLERWWSKQQGCTCLYLLVWRGTIIGPKDGTIRQYIWIINKEIHIKANLSTVEAVLKGWQSPEPRENKIQIFSVWEPSASAGRGQWRQKSKWSNRWIEGRAIS